MLLRWSLHSFAIALSPLQCPLQPNRSSCFFKYPKLTLTRGFVSAVPSIWPRHSQVSLATAGDHLRCHLREAFPDHLKQPIPSVLLAPVALSHNTYVLLCLFYFFSVSLALRTWHNIHVLCVFMLTVCFPSWNMKLAWDQGFCFVHYFDSFAQGRDSQITAYRLVFVRHASKEWLFLFLMVENSQKKNNITWHVKITWNLN